MATYKPQIKTNSGVEDIEIDASTLSGKDSSHYLNYNNLTNKPTVPTKTSQLTNDSGFKTTDTDTWRTISVNGTTIFGGATNTAGLNLQKGNNVTIEATAGSPNVKISATDTTYTFANGTNGFTVTPKGGTAQTVTVTPSIANATTSKAGLMSSTDKTNLDTLSNLLGDDSDTVVNKINEVIEIFDTYPEGDKIADALAGKQSKVSKLGSTSKPVYVSADGTFAEALTYAGGTKVTLNGTDKGASTATIYAPTAAPTSGSNKYTVRYGTDESVGWVPENQLDVATAVRATQDASGNVITSTYAKKEYAVYYVEGNTTGTAGTWTGTNNDITSLYDGLVINYKIGIAGADTTTLNINGLGAKTVYLRGTTKVTTHYDVGTMVLLAYNATTGAFYSSDYDANNYAYVRQYKTTTNANYPMLFAYETSLPSSYSTKYTRMNSNITANPSTGTINATSLIVSQNIDASNIYAANDLGAVTAEIEQLTVTDSITLNGSDVVTKSIESVIDLGMITEDPTSTTNSVLNAAVTPGNLYKFTKLGYSADGFSQVYFMFVSAQFQGNSSTPAIYQLIKPGFNTNTTYVRIRSTSGTWSTSTESLATEAQNFAAQKYAASGDTSSKLFLIGRTSQSTYGGITYSHDTVYVDTDGHLYDSGNRVLTTADSVSGGGTITGDYLPYYTVTLTDNTTPMSTVLSAYGNGLYAITFDGPASGKYIFNVQHQGGTRYGMSAIDINTNATSYYASEDMSTVTAADFKNSFTSFLKTTGGTITGDLTITYDSEGNGGSIYSSYIGMTDGEYSYGAWYADEGIYLGTGNEAQFYPYGLIFNGDNSSINLNGSNSNIFIPSVCGLINNADGNAFGFDEGGYPTILNHDGRFLQIATIALNDDYMNYEFPEYSGYVPVTETQGTSGQVLTSNGDGTYNWSTVSGGGGNSSFTRLEYDVFSLQSQSPMEIGLDYDPSKELIVYTKTQDGTYELSDDFGNTVSCEEIAVMHLNYMSEDGMLLGTMTSDTGESKPFISTNLSFFAESGNSIALRVKIYGR